MSLYYLHLDVFTDRLFGGNQLAVFLEPPSGLPAETMQAIALEMAFSETTFVFPAGAPGGEGVPEWRVRIFTPSCELPMAGHPTIGTAFALAQAGRIAPSASRVVFHEGVGPVPLDLEWERDRLVFAWMTQPRPAFGPVVADPAPFCAATNLDVHDVAAIGPIQQVSCGVPYVIIPVASRAALDRAAPEARAHARAFAGAGLPPGSVYLFTREPGPDGADVYARMFAPDLGIMEDPATGSAAGPLGAYLVHHGLVAADRVVRILQGVAMGRPSWIHAAPSAELKFCATAERVSSAELKFRATAARVSSAELKFCATAERVGQDFSPVQAPDLPGMRVGGRAVLAGEGSVFLQE